MALFSKQFRGDEVNEALAPAGPLHDQEPAASVDDMADSLFLTIAKRGIVQPGTYAK